MRWSGEGARGEDVEAAANVGELLGDGEVDEGVLRRGDRGWGTAARGGNGIGAEARSGVAAWEGFESAKDLLVDGCWDLAVVGKVVAEEVEDVAVLDVTAVVRALVNSLLECRNVPAVHKVAMVSVAGFVAVGEDEWVAGAVPFVGELGSVPDNLVEDGDETLWVGRGAETGVDAVRVGHVRPVVCGIEVHAVPA